MDKRLACRGSSMHHLCYPSGCLGEGFPKHSTQRETELDLKGPHSTRWATRCFYIGSCLSALDLTTAKINLFVFRTTERCLSRSIQVWNRSNTEVGDKNRHWSCRGHSCPRYQEEDDRPPLHGSCAPFLQHSANCLSTRFVLDQSLRGADGQTDNNIQTPAETNKPAERRASRRGGSSAAREETSSRIIRPEQHNNEHSSGSSALSLLARAVKQFDAFIQAINYESPDFHSGGRMEAMSRALKRHADNEPPIKSRFPSVTSPSLTSDLFISCLEWKPN